MAAPTTKLVTLTITEKGYDVAADVSPERLPTSAPALVAMALARRRCVGLAAPGRRLARQPARQWQRPARPGPRVRPNAWSRPWRHGSPGRCAFPNSVVDRMVPAPTEADRGGYRRCAGSDRPGRRACRATSLVDHPCRRTSWHRWPTSGVQLVDDVAPFERRKLWLLNGPHSAVAYGGLLAGHATIASAVTDPVDRPVRAGRIAEHARGRRRSRPGCTQRPSPRRRSRRFANPMLGHTCAQVGADGSSKLPQRLLPVVAARRERSLGTEGFAVVAAIWIAATAGIEVRGARLPRLADPMAGKLRADARHGESLRGISRDCARGPRRCLVRRRGGVGVGAADVPKGSACWSERNDRHAGSRRARARPWRSPSVRARRRWQGSTSTGRTLCVVIPDGTRNCPLPLLLQAVEEGVGGRARAVAAVVALGTHAPMSDDAMRALVGPVSMPRPQPRLVGGRHLHPGGPPAGAPRGGALRAADSTTPSTSASTGWSSTAT